MYVTRRLLRSTLEETAAPVKHEPTDAASEEDAILSPRKRRPLLQTQATKQSHQQKSNKSNNATKAKSRAGSPKQEENHGDKRNSAAKQVLRGMGMLIDARDSKERWCEAKILDLNATEASVYIHYVGWNTRYDCWLEAKCVAAHGSHTGAKKTSNSWNGKDSLFSDPTAPNKPTKAKTKPTPTPPKLVVSANAKKNKKRATSDSDVASKDDGKASKRTSHRAATVKVEVAVDAVDDESDRKARRGSRREEIDMELEMDVCGESVAKKATIKKEPAVAPPPAKRTRTSPTAKPRPAAISTKAKSPTAAPRKPSPRVGETEEQEAKTDSDETPAPTQLQSPTVGMSALRRSARAALVAKKAATKKRKSEEDDSDEEYKEDEDEDEEDEDDEDDEEDEADESDDDLPVRRSSSSNGKARRVSSSSSAPRRSSNSAITQWQTDPAYNATRERLLSIFRHRVHQRGGLGGDFHGSFQQAMSGSSAASTPRSAVDETDEPKEVVKGPKKKKAKTAQHVMTDEEKAAAAQFYYAQHYYHMQAYQYHQYMYQQALAAKQLEQQRLAEGKAAGGTDQASEGGDTDKKSTEGEPKPSAEACASTASSPTSQASIMNGGIIDPRFIQARMDALEHQKRMQLYYQHYNQATERNLQILAASPEYLQKGAALWGEQLQQGHPLSHEKKDEPVECNTAVTSDASDVEGKRSVDAVEAVQIKDDEGRQVENPSQPLLTKPTTESSHATTPEATPEAVEDATSAKAHCSPRSPEGQADTASAGTKPGTPQSSTSENQTPAAKPEAVLFELVL